MLLSFSPKDFFAFFGLIHPTFFSLFYFFMGEGCRMFSACTHGDVPTRVQTHSRATHGRDRTYCACASAFACLGACACVCIKSAEIFSRSVLATTAIAAPAFLESKTLSSLPTSPRHRKKSLERKLCRRIVRKEESARERERKSERRESLTDLRIQGSYPPTPPSPTPFFPLLSID